MSNCAAGCRVVEHKDDIRKINHIEKTLPRLLKEGLVYEDCTLLQSVPGTNIFEPWTGPDPSTIKGMVKCEVDASKWTQPCSAGVLLRGCVNAKAVCWPEELTLEEVQIVIACSTCCITFEFDYTGCNDKSPLKPIKPAEEGAQKEGGPELRGEV